MQQKLLVVDDEKMLTELLAAHLSNEGYLVYTANSADEALRLVNISPDLILLDINMPDMDGLELCRVIRSHLSCPILFLTARITEQDKVLGLGTGGDDYITKPFGLEELTARIAAHLRREARSRQAPGVIVSGRLFVSPGERTVSCGDKVVELSKREFDIVELLITHVGQVFDRERIYESVWGYDAQGDNLVVKEHIRKIRAKLCKLTGEDYIETVWGVGYKWRK